MTKETKESLSGKVTSWSIIGVVVAGTLLISGIADVSEGSGLMAKIFLLFIGAIIVVQVIPGIMLFSAMLKGIYGLFGKKVKVPLEQDKK
ncbi:hypothetical protein M1B72_18320 [Geomonas paludis]|uniref:Uncharacterized protein n=1 Tax=Geomonas paludis TaxID=2740185 RepID=A0A6V8MSF2_9BACT|nr:hypothetical protein [Geomonas paludis]UPU35377.1 hypothetical protein M1B72_18320 [Geomonas paludis]GFO63058.1 hypothetical protein GMPD_09770 [Geomonas paludis]